jgi:hypothetical protein
VLAHPDTDETFYLQMDTSTTRVGAMLSQGKGKKWHPIMYYSAIFSPTKQNYNIYEKEFLGVLKVLEHWRAYLIWFKEPFIIETD